MIQYEGPGWRLASDSSKTNYSYLIGGDNWAVEVSKEEWNILIPMVIELIDQHTKLKNQLMPEEKVSLEMEHYPWWALLDGDKNLWSLKLILNGNQQKTRSVELYWPVPNAQFITSAMRLMWDSNQ